MLKAFVDFLKVRSGNIFNQPEKIDCTHEKSIFEKFAPQLGEIIFHSVTVDSRIVEVTTAHCRKIIKTINEFGQIPAHRPLRFLEVGANAHYTGQLLTSELDADSTMLDISPNALLAGHKMAQNQGVGKIATLVACDYHDLPFNDGYFDVVFIAAAIHHTKRPKIVLQECLRVLAGDGLFLLDEEPCERLFSFNKFCTNREDEYTEVERYLADNELIRTVAFPHGGTRVEEQFGIIENDKIPLGLYLETVSTCTDILDISINYQTFVERLGSEFLRQSHLSEKELAVNIEDTLHRELFEAEKMIGDRERMLGFSLPTPSEITEMSLRMALSIKSLPDVGQGEERTHALTNIFGGVLCLIAKRKSEFHCNEKEELFSRSMRKEGLVWSEELSDNVGHIKLSNPLMADIQSDPQERLYENFSKREWEYIQEHNGIISMVNRGGAASIKIPPICRSAILLVRFYVVENVGDPYRILLLHRGEIVAELTVCQNETRFVRVMLKESSDHIIRCELKDLVGNAVELRGHLRVCVFQVIPLIISGNQ